MKFYVGEYIHRRPDKRPTTPSGVACFILMKSDWDDYHTTSSFGLEMKDKSGEVRPIGHLKILQQDVLATAPPTEFESLEEEFISLGQDLDFYTTLLDVCGFDLAVTVLESLRDISWAPDLSIPFETTSRFRNSMLRDNPTDEARRYGRSVINGEPIPEAFNFDYAGVIPGADGPTKIHVDFNPDDPIPGRIVGIIGRNAVGKTQYLAQLASDLAHSRKASQGTFDDRMKRFGGLRPSYNRIITISYSAFDRFPRPKDKNSSYVYCGLRNRDGRASKNHLLETYRENLKRVKEHRRENEWVKSMLEILGVGQDRMEELLNKEIQSDDGRLQDKDLSILSSGQAILANFITSILAWIDTKTLILFDEPEMHLHPNAVASLFQVFSRILNKFDSFALIATHSPLVIQELPSNRVLVFERDGNTTEAKQLASETFGENLSDLTRHIFETYEVPSYYKRVLKRISVNKTYEEALEYFPKGLSMNARSYLLSCYSEGEESEL